MAKQRQFSIMKKLALLICGLLVITISTYAIFSIWQFRNDKMKYVYLVNSTFTSAVGSKIDSFFRGIDRTRKNVTQLLSLSGHQSTGSAALLKTIFQNDERLASFALIDKKTLKQTGGLVNPNFMDIFQITPDRLWELSKAAVEQFDPTQSPMLFVNNTKDKVLTFVSRLNARSQLCEVFNVSMEFIHESLSESGVHEAYIVADDGSVLAHNQNPETTSPNLNTHPLISFLKKHNFAEGSMEYKLKKGSSEVTYIGNYYRLPNTLVFISQLDQTKAFEGMRTIMLNTVFFAAFLLGISIIISVMFSKTLTAPLQKLITITEDIAAGNFNVQVDIETNDEVAQLADSFVVLGKKLEERESQLEEATELAIRDGMTGLYNHRYFKNQLLNFFSLAARHNHELSLILFDVDHFKKVNDTYGHQQGDNVLKILSQILADSLRTTDIAARYGGEEFVVVLPDTDLQGALILAERIRETFMNTAIANPQSGNTMRCTCSAGVATFKNNNFATADDVIKHADENLYAAKHGGRNRVVAA